MKKQHSNGRPLVYTPIAVLLLAALTDRQKIKNTVSRRGNTHHAGCTMSSSSWSQRHERNHNERQAGRLSCTGRSFSVDKVASKLMCGWKKSLKHLSALDVGNEEGYIEYYFYVTVLAGRNLVAADIGYSSDPFAAVTYRGTTQRTVHQQETLNPAWDVFDVHVFDKGSFHDDEPVEVHIDVYDRDLGGLSNDFLGGVTIDLKDFEVDEVQVKWYPLHTSRGAQQVEPNLIVQHELRRDNAQPGVDGSVLPKDAFEEPIGAVQVRVQLGTTPTPPTSVFHNMASSSKIVLGQRAVIGKLRLEVISAHGLKNMDNIDSLSDPYVLIGFEGQMGRGKVVEDDLNPAWDHSWTFSVTELHSYVHICVYDYDMFGHDDPIGFLTVPISHLADLAGLLPDGTRRPWPTCDKPIRKWLRLSPVPEEGCPQISQSVPQCREDDQLGWILVGVGLDISPKVALQELLDPERLLDSGDATANPQIPSILKMQRYGNMAIDAAKFVSKFVKPDDPERQVDRVLTDLLTVAFAPTLPPSRQNASIKSLHGPMRRPWDNQKIGFSSQALRTEFARFVDVMTAVPLSIAASGLYLMEWRDERVNRAFSAIFLTLAIYGPMFRLIVEGTPVIFFSGIVIGVIYVSNKAWTEGKNDNVSVFERVEDKKVDKALARERRAINRMVSYKQKQEVLLEKKYAQKARRKGNKTSMRKESSAPVISNPLRELRAKMVKPLEKVASLSDRVERLGSLLACKCSWSLNVTFYIFVGLAVITFQMMLSTAFYLHRTIYLGRLMMIGFVLALNNVHPKFYRTALQSAASVELELKMLEASLDTPLVTLGKNYGFKAVHRMAHRAILARTSTAHMCLTDKDREAVMASVEREVGGDAESDESDEDDVQSSSPKKPSSQVSTPTRGTGRSSSLWNKLKSVVYLTAKPGESILPKSPSDQQLVKDFLASKQRQVRMEVENPNLARAEKEPMHKLFIKHATRLIDRGKTRYERAMDLQTINRWNIFASDVVRDEPSLSLDAVRMSAGVPASAWRPTLKRQ